MNKMEYGTAQWKAKQIYELMDNNKEKALTCLILILSSNPHSTINNGPVESLENYYLNVKNILETEYN